jgi:hypothetical protein
VNTLAARYRINEMEPSIPVGFIYEALISRISNSISLAGRPDGKGKSSRQHSSEKGKGRGGRGTRQQDHNRPLLGSSSYRPSLHASSSQNENQTRDPVRHWRENEKQRDAVEASEKQMQAEAEVLRKAEAARVQRAQAELAHATNVARLEVDILKKEKLLAFKRNMLEALDSDEKTPELEAARAQHEMLKAAFDSEEEYKTQTRAELGAQITDLEVRFRNAKTALMNCCDQRRQN